VSLSLKWEKWQNSDKNCKLVTLTSFVHLCYCSPIYTKGAFTWENAHRCESHTRMTFWFCIVFTWWLGHFTSHYLTVHFMLMKYMCDSKSHILRMRYPFQSTGRPISHWNGWSFCVYMIPLRVFVLEWNSRPSTRAWVNSCQGDLCRHDILRWYHVN